MGKSNQTVMDFHLKGGLSGLRPVTPKTKPGQRNAILDEIDGQFSDGSFIQLIDPKADRNTVALFRDIMKKMDADDVAEWGEAFVREVPLGVNMDLFGRRITAEAMQQIIDEMEDEDYEWPEEERAQMNAVSSVVAVMTGKGKGISVEDSKRVKRIFKLPVGAGSRMRQSLETLSESAQVLLRGSDTFLAFHYMNVYFTGFSKQGKKDPKVKGFIQKHHNQVDFGEITMNLIRSERDSLPQRR